MCIVLEFYDPRDFSLGFFADLSLSINSYSVRNELKPENFPMVDFNSYYAIYMEEIVMLM